VTEELRLRSQAALKRTRVEASKDTVLRRRLTVSDPGCDQLAARRLERAVLAARRSALVQRTHYAAHAQPFHLLRWRNAKHPRGRSASPRLGESEAPDPAIQHIGWRGSIKLSLRWRAATDVPGLGKSTLGAL